MIDSKGYRHNVAIAIINEDKQLLIAKRKNKKTWQLPQGGIDENETVIEALYRELDEEVGLEITDVEVLGKTKDWLYYDIPKEHKRKENPIIGQKQLWFLLKIKCADSKVRLDKHSDIEFDDWRWVDYWDAVEEVVDFKKDVYKKALSLLAQTIQI